MSDAALIIDQCPARHRSIGLKSRAMLWDRQVLCVQVHRLRQALAPLRQLAEANHRLLADLQEVPRLQRAAQNSLHRRRPPLVQRPMCIADMSLLEYLSVDACNPCHLYKAPLA